jgi:hypothetical protein
MLEQGYATRCIAPFILGDNLYDNPCQHVILVNFSYLASTLSKADFGPFTFLTVVGSAICLVVVIAPLGTDRHDCARH